MDFDDLQALLWAHEHGSLQRASRETGTSRATLRRRLERLDEAVGRQTHVTGPDGITLTAAGLTLVDEGAGLMVARERMLEKARGARSPRNTLRVLVQVGLPPRALATALELGSALLPGVHVHLDFEAWPAWRREQPYDAIVHWGDAPIVPTGFTRTLVRATFKVMASPDYLAAHGRPETPADLVDHSVLHLGGTDLFWPVVADAPVAISPVHTCADLYLLGLLAGQGLGLALLPVRGPLVDDTIAALVPVLGEHIEVHRSLRLDLQVPSQPGSAAAALVEVAASFGQDWTELPEVR